MHFHWPGALFRKAAMPKEKGVKGEIVHVAAFTEKVLCVDYEILTKLAD